MNKLTDIEMIKSTFVYLLLYKDKKVNSEMYDNIKNYCKNYIRNYIRRDTLEIIETAISEYYNIPIKLLQSKTRKREIVQARQMAMYFAKKLTNYSLAIIGQRFGMKDHGTVLHAVKTINNLIDTDKKVRNDIKKLERLINNKLKI